MSEPTPEPDPKSDREPRSEAETSEDGTTSGPTDEQLPGHRGDGPDPHPVDAAEADGGEGSLGGGVG